MNYNLPHSYVSRNSNFPNVDLPRNLAYQPKVYQLACYLAQHSNAKSIIVIGCGYGEKLIPFINKFHVIGVDSPNGISITRNVLPNAEYIEFDLEKGIPNFSENQLKDSIVICSDVIEHLKKPEYLMRDLARIANISPYVLISTPDRDRSRGWLDDGPPENPSYVREWAASEFIRFARDCGLTNTSFYGHTINTNTHRVKSTLLILTGKETVQPTSSTNDFSAAAIMHVYNEADILDEVICYINKQQIQLHVFDNWSTDGGWDILCKYRDKGLIQNLERFPDKPTNQYQWFNQLEKTTEYARSLEVNWIMHYDADEFRSSPWKHSSLLDAIQQVDKLGYNAIDFTVIDFRFLRTEPYVNSHYQDLINHFEFGCRQSHFNQIKAWKNDYHPDISSSGGHNADFVGRKVFPLKFLIKHYPLRNKDQANKKVKIDRLPRFHEEQSNRGWHTQYNDFQNILIEGWEFKDLIPWHPNYFLSEYIVERISGIGIID